jgi:hypothetical protein
LPRNERRDTHTDTDRWERLVKYDVGMDSDAMTYKPSFIKIGSGIQKLIGGGYTDSMEIA